MTHYDPAHVVSDLTPDPQLSSTYTATTELVVGEKPTVAKAVISGVSALGATMATALADGSVSATEWVTIVVGTIIAAAAVWATTNKS